jgi:hypothetical protein
MGWMTGVKFPAGVIRGFFSSPALPDGLWGPHSLLSNGNRGLSQEVNRPGDETDHSPSSSSEFKNVWRYYSTTPYIFMGGGVNYVRIHLQGV